ncbi:hypothetical protein FACS189434_09120 [Bacteroidia bacterium]|nr:hypothetical protein FACS189434_09120 [Bacteroidia bacterium]
MKKTILLLVAFAYCVSTWGQTSTTDSGVEINGVLWATRNVGAPGTFVDNPEDPGMFYQWNRNVGWSVTNPMENSNGNNIWNTTIPTGNIWETVNNVCPVGWRIPNREEQQSLLNASSYWTTIPTNGRVFGSEGSSIFLSATGYRYSNGTLAGVIPPEGGDYWSSTQSDSISAYFMVFGNNNIDCRSGRRDAGLSVRCVVDDSIIRVNHIELVDSTLYLVIGERDSLKATVFPYNATNKTVTWSSSDTSIVRVDANGEVTAVSAGYAYVTAQAGNQFVSCHIDVRNLSDANLRELSVRTASNYRNLQLTPSFNPDITEYTASCHFYNDRIYLYADATEYRAFINNANQGLKMYFLPDRAFISIEKMLCFVFFPVGNTQK